MSITDRTRKILWARSGNRCAICRCELVQSSNIDIDPDAIVGDECHIIGKTPDSARCQPYLSVDLDAYANLILLCKVHHKLIDDQPESYSTTLLTTTKHTHEEWVRTRLGHQLGHPKPVPFPIPKPRESFVGRAQELSSVRQWLFNSDDSILCVIAPGGYGKTELIAQTLTNVTLDGHSIISPGIAGILYIDCRAGASLTKLLGYCGRILGISDSMIIAYMNSDIDARVRIENLLSDMSDNGDIIIILDSFEVCLDDLTDRFIDDELGLFFDIIMGRRQRLKIAIATRKLPQYDWIRQIQIVDISKGLAPSEAVTLLRADGNDCGIDKEDDHTLEQLAERIYCIPKALISVVGYLYHHSFGGIGIAELIEDDDLFRDFDKHDAETGIKRLISEQLNKLDPRLFAIISVVSIFTSSVDDEMLSFMLPGWTTDLISLSMTRLFMNRLVSGSSNSYNLHPIIRELVYSCGQQSMGYDNMSSLTTTQTQLHLRASEFYRNKQQSGALDTFAIEQLEPYFAEIAHLLKADSIEMAFDRINSLTDEILSPWGLYKEIIRLRQSLTERLSSDVMLSANHRELSDAYRRIGFYSEALSHCDRSTEYADSANSPESLARALTLHGVILTNKGEYDESIVYHQKALEAGKICGSLQAQGVVLANLAFSYYRVCNLEEALQHLEESQAIFQEIGDIREERNGLIRMANIHLELRNNDRALDIIDHAIDLSTKVMDRSSLARLLCNKGIAYARIAYNAEAIVCFEESIVIAEEMGEAEPFYRSNLNLGRIYMREGDYQKAQAFLERGLESAKRYGNEDYASTLLNMLGCLYYYQARYNMATQFWKESCYVSRNINQKERHASNLANIGIGLACMGNFKEAIGYYRQSLRLAKNGNREIEANTLVNYGHALGCLGLHGHALKYLRHARKLKDGIGCHCVEIDSHFCSGLIQIRIGNVESAIFHFAEMIRLATDGCSSKFIHRANMWLAICNHHTRLYDISEEHYCKSLISVSPLSWHSSVIGLGILKLATDRQSEGIQLLLDGIQWCAEKIQSGEDSYIFTFKMALAQLAVGDTDSALNTYRSALDKNKAQGILVDALLDLKLLAEAREGCPGMGMALDHIMSAIPYRKTIVDNTLLSNVVCDH